MKAYVMRRAAVAAGIVSLSVSSWSLAAEPGAAAPAAGNQPAPAPVQLDDLVVTASRTARDQNTVPASVSVITSEDIAATTAQTVPDLLKHEAGIDVSDWYGTGRSTNVDIRGFGGNASMNTLVLVDGRRLNRPDDAGVDWTTIPLERIDRIEIVRGGNSVLYGDRAVGGVVNIRTKKGAGRNTVTSETTAGSYGAFKQAVGYAGSRGPLSYAVNGSYASSEGYRENSYFRNKTAGLSLSYEDNTWLSWDLSAGAKRDRYGMPGGRWPDQDRRGSGSPADYAETDATYVQFVPQFKLADDLEFSLGLSHSETDPFWLMWGTEGESRILENSLQPKLTWRPELACLQHEITAGVDYHNTQFNRIKGGTVKDMHKIEAGYYLNDTIALLPEKLFLDLGYRRSRLNFGFDEAGAAVTDLDTPFNTNAYRAGLTYAYARRSKAFVSVDRSFRAMNLDELGGPYGAFTNLLPPQTSWTYQAGVTHFFNRYLTASATVFQIDTCDEYFVDPLTWNNSNYAKTQRRGLELGATSNPCDSLTFFVNFTYMDAQLGKGPFDGNQIPDVPEFSGSFGGAWTPVKQVTLDVRARWLDNKLPISDWTNAGADWEGNDYITIDAKFTYRPLDWLELFVGVNNVFNTEYSDLAVWVGQPALYPSPERNFIGGMRITKEF